MGMAHKLAKTARKCYSKAVLAARFPKQVAGIKKLIDKPSYYPEMERKSQREMWMDNYKWLRRDNQLNVFYTSYGLDVKGFRNPEDFIPRREFLRKRNEGNQKMIETRSGKYNYITLLRDKYVFATFLASALGKQYVVDSVGIIDKEQLFLHRQGSWNGLEALLEMPGQWVFKVIDGECGEGVYLVTIEDGKLTIGDKSYSLREFRDEIIGKARWLIQPVVVQHDDLKAFGTKSVNTIRAITIRGKSGEIGIFNAFLRLGADSESFVDNRAMGGFGVGIDLDTGKLMKYGFPHDSFGVKAEEHPVSGIVFENYQLPFWEETVDLIKKAHKQFYALQSIGWDVVITPNGPILLEGNDDWEIGGPQDTYGGLKEKWTELTNA